MKGPADGGRVDRRDHVQLHELVGQQFHGPPGVPGRGRGAGEGDELGLLFDLEEVLQLPLRYNIAPTQEAAVVRVERPGEPRRLSLLRWGLIPYWAKEASIGNRMINARSEGVADKPAYKWSFRKQRCLIPTDGFYEWKKVAGGKQPYLIRRKDGKPFDKEETDLYKKRTGK